MIMIIIIIIIIIIIMIIVIIKLLWSWSFSTSTNSSSNKKVEHKKQEYKFIILKLRTEKSNPTCVTEQLLLRLYKPEQHHFVKGQINPKSKKKIFSHFKATKC